MAFDLNSIGALISGGGLNAISKRTKVNQEDVAKVLSAGIPALVGGMRRNAGAEAGAASLSRALADHSKDDVSNPAAFLKSADLKDGKKILGHVLGDDQKGLVDEISKAAGVTKGKTTTILALVAPLLLSLLGSQNSGSSGGGLLGMLGGLLGGGQSSGGGLLGGLLGGGQQPAQSQQSGGLLGSLLGGSSSGNASMASGLFSSLLGGGSSQSQNSIQLVDNAPQQTQPEDQSSGLLDSFLSLFH
ncbi:MAG: DUF937 domain-containing protein [Oscillospiraceae bacterium]|nr:DUF937 domain-containing protein [Oscillospiraceae bacterium]